MSEPIVTDNADASRFEIQVDGSVAGFAEYDLRDEGRTVAITHTEVGDAYAGQGLAKKLAVATLDTLRADGRALLPYCPFFQTFVKKNPEYLDLVPEESRTSFDL